MKLSDATLRFAAESLGGRYGKEAMKLPAISMDHIEGFSELPRIDQYDLAIEAIVEQAPLRILPHEKVHGAATLGGAILHRVPVTYQGNYLLSGVSHLTVNFKKILEKGYRGLYEEIEATRFSDSAQQRFLQSCLHCVRQFEKWHQRYAHLPALQRVPREPATSFAEAVQSLWFTFAFTRLCGNWPGIGRIDQLLGDYLQKDLQNGVITLDEARELLAHFFIKGCEWVGGTYGISGDAQHYQNIVLAGIDREGNEVTNPVTYLILDILEETRISDFPTTVRINKNTDPALLRRVAEVIQKGGGVVAVYNEELILDALIRYGYDPIEARDFANDGCWEVQIPGKTCFSYVPFDGLYLLKKTLIQPYPDMESLYQAYLKQLKETLENIFKSRTEHPYNTPCTVVSLLEESCIQKGRSYFEGGVTYWVASPHFGGLADVINSFYAIRKLVFEEKKTDFETLIRTLENNWEGQEELRQYARTHYRYYGNGNEEVDAIGARLIEDFASLCRKLDGRSPIKFPAGASTFGRQIEWAPHRIALPCGTKAGEVLAGNNSPSPGTDLEGATAVIRSYCRADLRNLVTGGALDLLLQPNTPAETIMALIRAFCSLGGFFMQMDIHDPALLREAQKNPEKYQGLSVRVSGWNARFATLNREWQEMIINRNAQQ
ncbi:MAG: hypothetical protein IJP27_05470 [Clostridia bacterium]|nr:hypothetical protein [Clostridia bacterium]